MLTTHLDPLTALRRAHATRTPVNWVVFYFLGITPAVLNHLATSLGYSDSIGVALLNLVIVIVIFYNAALIVENLVSTIRRSSGPVDEHLMFWPPAELKDPTVDSIAELQLLFGIDENGNAARHARGERE